VKVYGRQTTRSVGGEESYDFRENDSREDVEEIDTCDEDGRDKCM
jgi:hypothetical protein